MDPKDKVQKILCVTLAWLDGDALINPGIEEVYLHLPLCLVALLCNDISHCF